MSVEPFRNGLGKDCFLVRRNDKQAPSFLRASVVSCINNPPFNRVAETPEAPQHDSEVASWLFGWRTKQSVYVFEEDEGGALRPQDAVDFPPKDPLLSLDALSVRSRDRVVLTRETTDEELVFGYCRCR